MLSCSGVQGHVMHSVWFHTAQDWNPGTLCSSAGFPAPEVTSLRDWLSSLQSMSWVCTIPVLPGLAGRVNPWQTMGDAWPGAAALPAMGLTAGASQPGNPYWSGQLLRAWRVSLWGEWEYQWRCGLQSWILRYCSLRVFLSSLLLCVWSGEALVMVCQEDSSCFYCYCVILLMKTGFALWVAVTAMWLLWQLLQFQVCIYYMCYSSCTFHSSFLKTQPNDYSASPLYHICSVDFIMLWWDSMVGSNVTEISSLNVKGMASLYSRP